MNANFWTVYSYIVRVHGCVEIGWVGGNRAGDIGLGR